MIATFTLAWVLLASLAGGAQQQDVPETSQLSAAETLIEQHDYAKAREAVLQALTAKPDDVRAIYDLGYIEESTDHAKEAEQDYRRAIELDAALPQPHLALGRLLRDTARADESRQQYQLVGDDAKADGGLRGEALRALANMDADAHPVQARNELLEALKISPETPPDTLLTGRLAEAAGDDAVAAEAYQKLLNEKHLTEAATVALVRLELKQKKYADVIALAQPAHAAFPDDALLSAQLADALANTGKPAQALPLLEQAHAADPLSTPITRMLADVANENGRPDEAEVLYVALLKDHPKDPDMLTAYGASLVRQKRYFEAVPPLELAVQLKPDEGDAWGSLAFANSRLQKFDDCLKDLAERKKYLPENASTYYLWALAYDRLRRIKEAEDYYRRFLDAAGGKFPDQEFQVRHRLAAMEHR
jgi:tetratricopeptide (TPR) repeat protein